MHCRLLLMAGESFDIITRPGLWKGLEAWRGLCERWGSHQWVGARALIFGSSRNAKDGEHIIENVTDGVDRTKGAIGQLEKGPWVN